MKIIKNPLFWGGTKNQVSSLYTRDWLSQGLGTTLFLLATPMLFRVGIHTNLAAHFLILGGLYLNLRPFTKYQNYWWISLLLLSLGVHFYLFVMIFGLWIADLTDRSTPQNARHSKSNLISFGISLVLILIFAWQLGYFSVEAPSLFGYGFFKANLLSLFNANGWSLFMRDIPIKSSWGEANLYLGLGSILLLMFGFLKIKYWRIKALDILKRYRFLLVTMVLFLLFSITNQIGLGSLEVRIPFPQSLLQVFGILRHSARLFWPVYYAILIVGCILVIQNYSVGRARLIFFLCVGIQIIDLSPGLMNLHNKLNTPVKNDLTLSPLKQPFWKIAGSAYKNLYLLPSRSEPSPDFMSRFMSSDWRIFGRYAGVNQLNTNAVYMSRYDSYKQNLAFSNAVKTSTTGIYNQNTLYIIKNEDLIPVALGLKDENTLLANIDGFNVLAPNFLKISDINSISSYKVINIKSVRPELHQEISFKRPASQLSTYALTKDWNNREDWGVWSRGKDATLILPLPINEAKLLTIKLRAFVNGAITAQTVKIISDSEILGNYSLIKFEDNLIQMDIPASAKQKGYITLEFKLPNAASPSSIGIDDDSRVLGIGMVSARFD